VPELRLPFYEKSRSGASPFRSRALPTFFHAASDAGEARFVCVLRNDAPIEDHVCGEPIATSPRWRARAGHRVW
jgi:hypothetical protein